MKFSSRITRTPRAFNPERGAEARALYSVAPEIAALLEGTAGSSPFLRGIIEKEVSWLTDALAGTPEDAFNALMNVVRGLEASEMSAGLRIAKRRVAVLTALCDLGGVWPLEKVTGALSDFADLAVDVAIKSLLAAELKRGKVPGASLDDLDDAAGMSVLAMGKMGAGELNYSSDIDLICLYDESRYEPDDYSEVRTAFVRVTRRAMRLLSDLTGEGYVFRTDLRLRPDPSVTPVCLSMEAAERYYESVGRTWERAAHIKARACAGDIAAGQAYLERLSPFIWRKQLDFASIQDAHDMRLRIRDHKGLHGPIVLEGHNMKLGAGGIREIEFFTQTRQIIAGGRDAGLRSRETVEGLSQLAAADWITEDVSDTLAADYRAHREVEHRLQMVNDAQTHDLPKSPEGFARIAALSGRDVDEMRGDIFERLSRVSELTEGFFAPTDAAEPVVLPDASVEIVERWPAYPALRSERAVEIFERLRPEILTRLQKAARPQEALIQFDKFLAGLPAGVQVFSMFEANPQLIDLIVDIAATAPELAVYLGQNSQVFDAVIGGGFFADWPDDAVLLQDLQTVVDDQSDYESKLDAARRWKKEWHFRVGVHHLRGLIGANESGVQYAALAEAILRSIWDVVVTEFARKYGPPPGVGATVIGMGSMGGQRLTATSDLDLIVIYDADGVEQSDGKRSLPSRTYYARLTQALVTALAAPMAEGRLYEVDMRLRPSGRQGPVATSFEAFCTYQRDEAWTWEHLALTRARYVAGDDTLGARVEKFRCTLLKEKSDVVGILKDVADMRDRISAAKTVKNDWEVKLGAGRIQDIELIAQAATLIAGTPIRGVVEQIKAGREIGMFTPDGADVLVETYNLMWQVQSAGKLLSDDTLDPGEIGQGATAFLLHEVERQEAGLLAVELHDKAAQALSVIEDALQWTQG